MAQYRELFDVHLKYIDYLASKTLLIHQYLRGVRESGSSVEIELRFLLQTLLPARYKITHGYIASAEDFVTEPSVSPQVDIIIVDNLVPNSLWLVDRSIEMEVVPAEAVVGVIEVKRTLDRESVKGAIQQIQAIRDASHLTKTDETQYLPGGTKLGDGLTGPYHSNPLFGIMGVKAEPPFANHPIEDIRTLLDDSSVEGHASLELDFVASLSGIFVGTCDLNNSYVALNPRQSTPSKWCEESARTRRDPRVAIASCFGFILNYLASTCGKQPDLANYYFNTAIRG